MKRRAHVLLAYCSHLSCGSSRAILRAILVSAILYLTQAAAAQTFNVLYSFGGGLDGQNPFSGVTIGPRGDLYGTTIGGGLRGRGSVYRLQRRGSGWFLNPLYEFSDPADGSGAYAGIAFGPDGVPYGTTTHGGLGDKGTVFDVRPTTATCNSAICFWHENAIHLFQGGGNDGQTPGSGRLAFDSAGNIYGTTQLGGSTDYGIVYKMSRSGRQWTLDVLHSFTPDANDGNDPVGGVVLDSAGNLYGTTSHGGSLGATGPGTIFQLTPSEGIWTESILFNFDTGLSGEYPMGTLIMDDFGSLYGTSFSGGSGGGGTVFELSPSGGSWTFSVLYSFTACSSTAGVTMDAAGNLFGVCSHGGAYGYGMAYKLTRSSGPWTLADLHDFTSGMDGGFPEGSVTLDSSGNLYGTTAFGGDHDAGAIWQIATQ